MRLGTHLTIIRKEHKISRSELAQKAGIYSDELGRYEREEATLSVEMAAKITDVLGISFDNLVGKQIPNSTSLFWIKVVTMA